MYFQNSKIPSFQLVQKQLIDLFALCYTVGNFVPIFKILYIDFALSGSFMMKFLS